MRMLRLRQVAADLICAGIAFTIVYAVSLQDSRFLDVGALFSLIAFVVLDIGGIALAGVYDRNVQKERFLLLRVGVSMVVTLILVFSLTAFVPSIFGFGQQVLFVTFSGAAHFGWRVARLHCSFHLSFARKILVLGTGPFARFIGSIISGTNHHVLTGYVDCAREPLFVPSYAIVGREDGLMEAAKREKARQIVVSLSERRGVFPLRNALTCKMNGIDVIDAASFYEKVTGKLLLESITPGWLIFSRGFRVTTIMRWCKRLTDILCAIIGILMFAPFFPLVALLIKLDSRGPLFFSQLRVGEGEKTFSVIKFRTMVQDAEVKTGAVWASENDPRVTRVGRFLRTMRIDEIPQLINILRGDMSLVGPRPERPEFVDRLKEIVPFYSERHVLKPGVTGWAQVSYPYGASVEDALEKLRYDLYYIKNFSLFFDLRIILKTISVVLGRKGGR